MRRGVLAEFESPEAVEAAAERVHALGYRRIEAFSPYPLERLEALVGARGSPVPAITLAAAVAGGVGAYLLQWWVSARAYPLDVGGRPLHSAPAFVPITFEMVVLSASLAAFVALLALCGLPRLWHPVFEVPGFESASIDRFWLGVDLDDPRFASDALAGELARLGASRVVRLGLEP